MKKYHITTRKMELVLANKFNFKVNIIVPNVSWGLDLHECDLLMFTKQGFLTEVEIKRSIEDLRADFAKKHQHKSRYIKNFYYAFPDYMEEKAMEIIPKEIGVVVIRLHKYDDGSMKTFHADIVRRPVPNKDLLPLKKGYAERILRLGLMRTWKAKEDITLLEERLEQQEEVIRTLIKISHLDGLSIKTMLKEWEVFRSIAARQMKTKDRLDYRPGENPFVWNPGVNSENYSKWVDIECFNPS